MSKQYQNQKKKFEEKGYNKVKQEIINLINNIENPYPEDIFPKIEKGELKLVEVFLLKQVPRISMDKLSAHLMRIARENLKEDIIKLIKEVKPSVYRQ